MDAQQVIEGEAGKCRRCGTCREACDIAASVGQALLPDVACAIAQADEDERMQWFATRCSLCGRCAFTCPEHVDVPAMIVAARSMLIRRGASDADKYQAMRVDNDWNAITLYRDVYGLDFAPYRREGAPVAFLPGCTLLNVAPEAALKTREWLEGAFGCAVSLVDRCCGMPLQEMGLVDRYEAYLDDLVGRLAEAGTRKLIVACPNCLGRLAQHGSRAGIAVQIAYEPMAAMGLRVPVAGGGTACIHDSCPARGTRIGAWVRALLADWNIVETRNCGDCSQCCGSGGAVGMYDAVLAGLRAQRRRDELLETGAEVCVTYCMSSCSTLFDEQAFPHARHVLELAFGALADHAGHARRVQEMWRGDMGARCDALLAGAESAIGVSR